MRQGRQSDDAIVREIDESRKAGQVQDQAVVEVEGASSFAGLKVGLEVLVRCFGG